MTLKTKSTRPGSFNMTSVEQILALGTTPPLLPFSTMEKQRKGEV